MKPKEIHIHIIQENSPFAVLGYMVCQTLEGRVGKKRVVVASLVLSAALCSASASAADSGTCPPLKGVVLHLIVASQGYLLPVSVAGTSRLFMLDLGSAFSKIDEAVATELKLPRQKAPLEVMDNLGAFTQIATAPSIKLGAVVRGDSQMLVGAHRERWGSADGVAGMNMFSGFDVELDLAHKRLGLYLPRDCSFQPFWPADVFGEAPFNIEATGHIILPLKLDGKEIQADMLMSSPLSVMPLEAAHILFDIDKDDSRLKQHNKDVFSFPFKVLMGGEKVAVENPQIAIVQKDGMLCSGIAGQRQEKERMMRGDHKSCYGGGDVQLGTNLLRKLHLYFSYKDKKVYFTAAEPAVQPVPPESKGQYDEAIADYSLVIRLKPNDAFAFYARGYAYQATGQYDEAIADYSQAISLKPNDAAGFNERCWVRALAERQLDDALADCNKSLQLRPNYASTLDSRGFVYFRMGNYPAAIADYNAALAGNPKGASSFFVRGLTKQKLGDAAGGEGDIAAAKKLDPNVAETYAKYGVTQR